MQILMSAWGVQLVFVSASVICESFLPRISANSQDGKVVIHHCGRKHACVLPESFTEEIISLQHIRRRSTSMHQQAPQNIHSWIAWSIRSVFKLIQSKCKLQLNLLNSLEIHGNFLSRFYIHLVQCNDRNICANPCSSLPGKNAKRFPGLDLTRSERYITTCHLLNI